MTKITLLMLMMIAIGATACRSNEKGSGTVTQQAEQKEQKPDGSIIETHKASDGTKVEARVFEEGELTRVTRISRTDGKRTALVEFRDGRTAVVTDESDVEQAMDATTDAIVAAANKSWEIMGRTGAVVADKTEDAADKAADVGKDVGRTVTKGTKKVGKKVKDAVTP